MEQPRARVAVADVSACVPGVESHAMPEHLPRRAFLRSLAAFGVGAVLPEAASAQTAGRRIIDVHCHFSSPGFIAAIKARNTGQRPLMEWTPAKALEDMDRDGVATSIVSTSEPNVWF